MAVYTGYDAAGQRAVASALSRRRLLHETGVLWLFGEDDGYGRASAEVLRAHGARLDAVTLTERGRRYPQIAFGGIRSVFWEPDAGYLFDAGAARTSSSI